MAGAVYRNSSSSRRGRAAKADDQPKTRRLFLTSQGQDGSPPLHNIRRDTPGSSILAPDDESETAASRSVKRSSKKDSRTTDGTSSLVVRLTPSMLIMLAILLLVTLSFFFLFGLIIGRGSVPPVEPPTLEKLDPAGDSTPEAPEKILPKEDLHFMSRLKAEGDAEVESKPSSATTTVTTNAPRNGQTGQSGGNQPQQVDKTVYDYVIRVAAFKAEEQADALRAKLEGVGMRTRLVREKAQKGTWHFVQILHRGNPESMNAKRAELEQFGIRDSLVSSKTPVE